MILYRSLLSDIMDQVEKVLPTIIPDKLKDDHPLMRKTKTMICIEHLTKSFGKFKALDDISLEFEPGKYDLLTRPEWFRKNYTY